jgi:2-methylcitrate dehydratase PrpD
MTSQTPAAGARADTLAAVPHDAPDAIATTLAGFTHRLRLSDVPEDVSLRARHLMLDAIGCALAARREDFAERFERAAHALPGADVPEACTAGAMGFARRLPLRDATLLNGILAHGLDYDDTHMAGVLHLSVSVLPALYNMAARRRASGADLLAAYIAGLESGARIASVVKSGFHGQGFHPTAVVGVFASALAVGRLVGLDAPGLVDAQGIALSMASGSLQFIEDGSWTKRIHPGWAAQSGITAALFAQQGIPAPHAPYTGRYGLYRSYLDTGRQAAVDLALGTAHLDADGRATAWELENIAVKPFPMCHFVHASADAAIALHRQGLDIDQVLGVEVAVPAGVVQAVCEPLAAKRRPTSDYDAKFSLPYAVASGLARGRLGLAELDPAAFADPALRALMDRVHYVEDPASTFPRHYTGEVRLRMRDGSVRTHREPVNRGHAERPLTNAEVREKYLDNATRHFPLAHAEAVRDQVLALDRLPSVETLESLLAADPAPQPSARRPAPPAAALPALH